VENPNQVSNSPLDRLVALERTIRNFRIVQAGRGTLTGGFPRLPRSDDFATRLSNAEKAVRSFWLLGGDGLTVSGNFKEGFVCKSPPCEQTGGGGPPPLLDALTLTI